MAAKPSDAIVFFGATGDLAYKQIVPALLGLVHDEGLGVPIVGAAKAGWTLEQLKARALDSLRHDIVDTQWRIVEPILDNATPVYPYHAGTWCPEEAQALIGTDGPWRNPNIAAEPFT